MEPLMLRAVDAARKLRRLPVREDYVPPVDKVQKLYEGSTEAAKERTRKLCKEMGLFVGISAGANVLAAERWIEQNNPEGIVFTSLCDRGERYCSIL